MPVIHDQQVDKKSFAARLLELRERANLSQVEIERRSNKQIQQGNYSQWERGLGTPNVTQIPVLALALGVEIWELFEDPSEAAVVLWQANDRLRKRKAKKREQADDD